MTATEKPHRFSVGSLVVCIHLNDIKNYRREGLAPLEISIQTGKTYLVEQADFHSSDGEPFIRLEGDPNRWNWWEGRFELVVPETALPSPDRTLDDIELAKLLIEDMDNG